MTVAETEERIIRYNNAFTETLAELLREDPDVFINIQKYLDVKVDSLGAHASQMSSTREERLERIKNNSGRHREKTGLEYAEGFRRITFNLGSLEWQLMHR